MGWIMRDRPKRLAFDRIIDELEQIHKLPEVATKAPPVEPAAHDLNAQYLSPMLLIMTRVPLGCRHYTDIGFTHHVWTIHFRG